MLLAIKQYIFVFKCWKVVLSLNIFWHFSELTEFKSRRISYFKKHLVDLAELELKHSKVIYEVDALDMK